MNPILTFPAVSKSSKIKSISLYALFRSPISVLSLEPEYVTRQESGSTVNDGHTNSGYHVSLGFCRNLHLKISRSFIGSLFWKIRNKIFLLLYENRANQALVCWHKIKKWVTSMSHNPHCWRIFIYFGCRIRMILSRNVKHLINGQISKNNRRRRFWSKRYSPVYFYDRDQQNFVSFEELFWTSTIRPDSSTETLSI